MKKELTINEGEYICSECNGNGHIKNEKYISCKRCQGEGKLDWIENIVGKKPNQKILRGLNWENKHPNSPIHGDTYYNALDNIMYIYNSDTSTWYHV